VRSGPVWVGTSGYNYPEWRGSFYPSGFPTSEMLAFYVRHFRTVEINYTSYQFPKPKNIEAWQAATPDGFKLALKVPRRVTYGPAAFKAAGQLQRFYEIVAPLGDRLGPVLMQLPVGFACDMNLLRALMAAVPSGMRTAIELRDASWHSDEVFEVLRAHDVGLCISDSEELTTPVVRTAEVGYFRLRHEGYDDADLARWAADIMAFGGEVFVYFKHEGTGSGPRFAEQLLTHMKGEQQHG
jgi:uncharacterized protein YecE (DUF72 family)